ncbi:hypothetical protein BVY03_04535 [bacterium K02(2017)]|nr:hypothetical protein BVY03_04535 [bacterium K02(2017)]
MNDAISSMLKKYNFKSIENYENALHEIMQQVALLGLWRAKFFEHVAFYGGTALRILYGLDRFSEDLDFTLLKPNPEFTLTNYFKAIEDELTAFNFEVDIIQKEKILDSQIESAFIKANTLNQIIQIGFTGKGDKNKLVKIKFEIDRDPPLKFNTEAKMVLMPTPFYIKTLCPDDLFAGKVHALLFRNWKIRVKGRDWYDFVWYVSRQIPLHLNHLIERIYQSHPEYNNEVLNKNKIIQLIKDRINQLDIKQAKKDVEPFIKDPKSIDIWSKEFFNDLTDRLTFS